MKKNIVIPEYAKDKMVNDCKNVYEFALKYRKSERFTQQGENYVNVVMASHMIDLEERGYTLISRYDNVTGRMIGYIRQKSDFELKK